MKKAHTNHIVDQLRLNNEKVLNDVYLEYREPFIAFAKKYGLKNEDALDVFQDAVIAMHQNFVVKQVTLNKNVSLKTYLFAIGKNIIKNRLKKEHRMYVVNDFNTGMAVDEESEPIDPELISKMQKGFEKLGKKCKEIITLFYYRGFSILEIVDRMGYKDANTVKSQKSRCLKQLKTLTKKPHG